MNQDYESLSSKWTIHNGPNESDESSNLNVHTIDDDAMVRNQGFSDLNDHDDTCNPTSLN